MHVAMVSLCDHRTFARACATHDACCAGTLCWCLSCAGAWYTCVNVQARRCIRMYLLCLLIAIRRRKLHRRSTNWDSESVALRAPGCERQFTWQRGLLRAAQVQLALTTTVVCGSLQQSAINLSCSEHPILACTNVQEDAWKLSRNIQEVVCDQSIPVVWTGQNVRNP